MNAPANPWAVVACVAVGCGIAALPLYFQKVRDQENKIAEHRFVHKLASNFTVLKHTVLP
jgi:hypothetical protein